MFNIKDFETFPRANHASSIDHGEPVRRRPVRCRSLDSGRAPTPAFDVVRNAAAPSIPTSKTPQTVEEQRLGFFMQVFRGPQRNHFRGFLNNVLYKLDADKFLALVDHVLGQNPTYEEFYTQMLARVGEAQATNMLGKDLTALKVIRKTLAAQAAQLTAPGITVDTYLELGYSCRLARTLEKAQNITIRGQKIAVSDSEAGVLAETLAGGNITKPYDRFAPLDNYAPLTDRIASQSVDFAICPIGLHHCPTEMFDTFVDSIAAVMRPGGSFILRDHDVTNSDRLALAHMAHSVFNIANAVPYGDEIREFRDFRSMDHWAHVLKKHGFERQEGNLVQEGDPSENTLARFVRLADNEGEREAEVDGRLRHGTPGYVRGLEQTELTRLEWHLVAQPKEYAEFLTRQSPANYPYFTQMGTVWNVFKNSVRDAIGLSGARRVVGNGDYMLMNLFMLGATLPELAFKGLTYKVLQSFSDANNDHHEAVAVQRLAHITREYADFLKTTPFYAFPYFSKMGEMLKSLPEGLFSRHGLVNLFVTAATVAEFGVKGVLSLPVASYTGNTETDTVHVVVNDAQHAVRTHDTVQVLAQDSFNGKVKGLRVPRYQAFLRTVADLTQRGVQVLSIAGQKTVQLKVKTTLDDRSLLRGVRGATKLDSIAIVGQPSQLDKYRCLNVQVIELGHVMQTLQERGAEVAYIHDF